MQGESGRRRELTWESTEGRLLIQCREKELMTAEKEFGGKCCETVSSSSTRLYMVGSNGFAGPSENGGISASLCRSERERSVQIRFSILRVGGDVG